MLRMSLAIIGSMALAAAVGALPVSQNQTYNVRNIHSFSNRTWIENMAVRSNGQILATDTDAGRVFLVDPTKPQTFQPPVIANLGNTTAVLGITELEDDVFYAVAIANSDGVNLQLSPNSSSIWRIDMREYLLTGSADVKKAVDMPELLAPNGITVLSKAAGTLLIADAGTGTIWRYDAHIGSYEVVIDEAILKPVAVGKLSVGVNGLRVLESTLYFSSTGQGVLGTFPISHDGRATGPAHVISSDVKNADDFAVGLDGSIWLAENQSNKIVRVYPDGTVVTIADGATQPLLNMPVSARFGRTECDRNVLYISTNGFAFNQQGVRIATDGKVVAIDT